MDETIERYQCDICGKLFRIEELIDKKVLQFCEKCETDRVEELKWIYRDLD